MTALQQVSSPLILMPAYGRTYETVSDMLKDWRAGKGFRIVGHGCYTSIRDINMLRAGSSSVTLSDPRTSISFKV